MKECRWAVKHLIDRIEGELDEAEERVFDDHIRECPACREAYETTRRLFARLKDDISAPGDAYWDSLRRRIREREIPLGARRFRFKVFIPVLVPVAAACVLLVVLLTSRPSPDIEDLVPVSELLGDKDIARLTLPGIVHDELLDDFAIIEESLPIDIDEMIGEMTLEEQRSFVELMISKYGYKI